MYILKEFHVDDMWAERNAKIFFNDDVNFLIGENSSGKTTIIYLLASLLNLDEEKIRKFDFNNCKLILENKNNPTKCIEIKCVNSELFRIIFTDENGFSKLLKSDRGGFFLDIWAEKNDKNDKKDFISKKDLKNKLNKIVNLTWLSIHRNTENYQNIDTYYQPIDQRLSEIKSGLMKYFSSQAQKYDEEVTNFQKNIFLEFIDPTIDTNLTGIISGIDLDETASDIRKIFDMLKLDDAESKIEKLLEKYINSINMLEMHNEDKPTFGVENYVDIYNLARVSAIIQKYNDLNKKKDDIYYLQNKFVDTLNKFFGFTKKAIINSQNELIFMKNKTDLDKSKSKNSRIEFDINDLSSGEKQIVILLAETLLQDKKVAIFIADEPELSLHLKWQSLLTESIRSLNPNAQILFATHSPDIVSIFNNKIIKMKDVLR